MQSFTPHTSHSAVIIRVRCLSQQNISSDWIRRFLKHEPSFNKLAAVRITEPVPSFILVIPRGGVHTASHQATQYQHKLTVECSEIS